MAGGADLTVDLEAATEALMVVGLVEFGVLPWVWGGVESAVVCELAYERSLYCLQPNWTSVPDAI